MGQTRDDGGMRTNRGFFAVLLFLVAAGSIIWTLLAIGSSESAIHEIEALIGALITTVCIAAGYIGGVLDASFNRMAPPVVQPQQHGQQQR